MVLGSRNHPKKTFRENLGIGYHFGPVKRQERRRRDILKEGGKRLIFRHHPCHCTITGSRRTMTSYLRHKAPSCHPFAPRIAPEEKIEQQPQEGYENEYHNPRKRLYGIMVPQHHPHHNHYGHYPIEPIENSNCGDCTTTHLLLEIFFYKHHCRPKDVTDTGKHAA